MSQRATTSKSYGDLVGTVEIDGHNARPLVELAAMANMPPNFCPIGVEISLFESFDGIVYFALLAYDSDIVGCRPEDATAFVQTHGRLPVRRFIGRLQPTHAHKFFKRCLLVAVDSRTVSVCDRLEIVENDVRPRTVALPNYLSKRAVGEIIR